MITENSLHMGRLWHHMGSCQPTVGLTILLLYKKPILQLVDNCTYGNIAFPCEKTSMLRSGRKRIYLVAFPDHSEDYNLVEF